MLKISFQSTLPVGGATPVYGHRQGAGAISIHAPRGGSDARAGRRAAYFSISIHAPRGGSDARPSTVTCRADDFNPRSPWGERRSMPPTEDAEILISIHAPRGGSDYIRRGSVQIPWYFNPRSPWGERRYPLMDVSVFDLFQSTLPVGGATFNLTRFSSACCISIHAPRGGSDAPFYRLQTWRS